MRWSRTAIADERVEGEHRAEGATADDDDVERSTIDAGGAGDRLVEPVAEVAAEHVLGEVRVLGGGARHGRPVAAASGGVPSRVGGSGCISRRVTPVR